MLTSIVWRCYALTFLLAVVSCSSASRSKRTPEAANGTRPVRDTPSIHRRALRRDSAAYQGSIQLTVQDEVVNMHNDYRRKEGSSNMKKLTWNISLADKATEIAKLCGFGMPQGSSVLDVDSHDVIEFHDVENNRGFKFVIDHWMSEKSNFDGNKNKCPSDKVCIHYQEIVWPSNEQVGCAYAKCDMLEGFVANSFLYVCVYHPGMKHSRLANERIEFGSPCSTCIGHQWCEDGLCVDSCGGSNCICKSECHCGKKDMKNCRCDCTAGYMGPNCVEMCHDNSGCGDCDVLDKETGICIIPRNYTEKCPNDPVLQQNCAVRCKYCIESPFGVENQKCDVDKIEASHNGADPSLPLLKMSMQLLVEIVLLLCLQNYI